MGRLYRESARAIASVVTSLVFAALAPAAAASEVTGWGRQVVLGEEALAGIETVVAGGAFNAGIRSGGEVVVWGANNHRQAIVPEGLGEVTAIAAGHAHLVAILADGSVAAWGNNRQGQASPPRDLGTAVAVAAGHEHSLALLEDGSVVAWGSDESGQSTVPEGLEGARAIEAGEFHSLALLDDGTVVAWGQGEAAEIPEDLPPLQAISAGNRHNLGLTEEGRVIAWGENDHGQTEVPRGLRGITEIRAGGEHNLVRRGTGTVIGWGRDQEGQSAVPPRVGPASVIAAGGRHSLAITAEGVSAWGANDFGQSLTPAALTGTVQVSSRGNQTIVLKEDGSFVTWGSIPGAADEPEPENIEDVVQVAAGGNHFLALRRDGTVVAWGDNTFRQLEGAEQLENIIAIAAGEYHNLALRNDGRVVSWGSIIDAQQVPEGLTDIIAIDAGPFHSLALRSNGTVRAWGNNFYGETSVPSGLRNVAEIAAGDFHSLALLRDGRVAAWGSNFFGQATPPPGLDSVTAIAAGSTHNLATRGDGSLVAWGSDFYGQTDVREELENVVALAAGGSHSLAVSGDPTPPRVFAQTGPEVVDAGETVVLNVFATGSPPLRFQWTHNNSLISEARSQSLILENVTSNQQGEYKALIASPTGNVVSEIFSLQVRDPAIARHPDSRAVRLGGHAILRAAGAGTEPFEYQWKLDGEPVSGATEPVLEITDVAVEQTGIYTVEVSNEHGTVESNPARVIAAPQFVQEVPEIFPATPGQPATLTVEVAGSPPLSYQWEYNEEMIRGANEAELTIPEVQLEHAGVYRVTAWNDAGHVTSRDARMVIRPAIALQPQSQVLPIGGTAVFEVRAVGSEPMNYRWLHDGEVVQESESSQLILENIEPRDGGVYTVEVVNLAGRQSSREARLVAPPGIARHPGSREAQAGETVRFTVEALGAEPIRFQWEKNREPIPGATSATLVIENTRGDDSGSYRVRVMNEAGEAVSRSAILRLAPRIVSHPDPVSVTPGQRAVFEVEAEGTSPLSYQWMKDGVPIEEAREAALEIPAVGDGDEGSYTVMVSNAAGIQLSEPAPLSLNDERVYGERN